MLCGGWCSSYYTPESSSDSESDPVYYKPPNMTGSNHTYYVGKNFTTQSFYPSPSDSDSSDQMVYYVAANMTNHTYYNANKTYYVVEDRCLPHPLTAAPLVCVCGRPRASARLDIELSAGEPILSRRVLCCKPKHSAGVALRCSPADTRAGFCVAVRTRIATRRFTTSRLTSRSTPTRRTTWLRATTRMSSQTLTPTPPRCTMCRRT